MTSTTETTSTARQRDALRALALEVLRTIAPEATDVPGGADLRDELDLDSMDFLGFVIGLHKKTGVEIPERDYNRLATLDGVVTYLAEKTAP